MPAVSEPSIGVTCSVAGAVVAESGAVSQPEAPAPYETPVESPERVPVPLLVTLTVWAAGEAPPLTALNESVDGDAAITGVGPVTTWNCTAPAITSYSAGPAAVTWTVPAVPERASCTLAGTPTIWPSALADWPVATPNVTCVAGP